MPKPIEQMTPAERRDWLMSECDQFRDKLAQWAKREIPCRIENQNRAGSRLTIVLEVDY